MKSLSIPTQKIRIEVLVAALVLLAAALVMPQFVLADHSSDHPNSQFDIVGSASNLLAREVSEAASTARWVALGDFYTEKAESAASVSSARWAALGNSYNSYAMESSESAAAASTARWVALGKYYAEKGN